MHLESLDLLNFKNYEEINLSFSSEINCLVGDNGSGKTNLLDAIYYLSMTKSAFNPIDSQNIRHGEQLMLIRGYFLKTENREESTEKNAADSLREKSLKSNEGSSEEPIEESSQENSEGSTEKSTDGSREENSEGSSWESMKKASKRERIQCSLQQGQRKIFKHNKKNYDKISEHIGRYPVVLIAPNDTDLIREGSESRRRFFDSILSQLDQQYLQWLMQYNHSLKQRNSLLKHFAEKNTLDRDLLEPYNQNLLQLGGHLLQARKDFLHEYLPYFLNHYHNLSQGREKPRIRYESNMDVANPAASLENSLRRDLVLQRSNIGIHKDDFVFELDDYALKKFGSQGQQKSFLISLKLAQFDILRQHKGFKPILLLDDIFDKLDEQRIAKLMELVSGHNFGQLFVTDARPERTQRIFQQLNDTDVKIYKIDAGKAADMPLE